MSSVNRFLVTTLAVLALSLSSVGGVALADPGPDLIIGRIGLRVVNHSDGSCTIEPTVVERNRGDTTASTHFVSVRYLVGGTDLGSINYFVSSLPPHKSVQFSDPVNTTLNGSVTVEATADVNNLVSEDNEGNNFKAKTSARECI